MAFGGECTTILLDFRPISTAPITPGKSFGPCYLTTEDHGVIHRGYYDGVGWVLYDGDPFEPCCWADISPIHDDDLVDAARRAAVDNHA
jgi:hypothetical protein